MPTIVFISYSWDSDEHSGRVRRLADGLRSEGLEVVLDSDVKGAPPEQWPLWMSNNVERATYVLCVCSAAYQERFRSPAPSGVGSEARLIAAAMDHDAERRTRVFAVQFDAERPLDIPLMLRGGSRYLLPRDERRLLETLRSAPASAGAGASRASQAGTTPSTERERARWRGPDGRNTFRQWLEMELRRTVDVVRALRDGLVELGPDLASRFEVRDVELPAVVAEALLDAAPTVAVGALNRAHRYTTGDVRRAIGAILFRAVCYLGEYDQMRASVSADATEVVLPIGTRTLAEIVSAGIDGEPASLVPDVLQPVGRHGAELQPEMLVPMVAWKPPSSASSTPPLTDQEKAFADGLAVAVCRYSGQGHEKLKRVMELYDGRTDDSRINRMVYLQRVLAQIKATTGRTHYLLCVDADLGAKVPDRAQLWRVVGELVRDPRTGIPGLRTVRVKAQPSEVPCELDVAMHIADVVMT